MNGKGSMAKGSLLSLLMKGGRICGGTTRLALGIQRYTWPVIHLTEKLQNAARRGIAIILSLSGTCFHLEHTRSQLLVISRALVNYNRESREPGTLELLTSEMGFLEYLPLEQVGITDDDGVRSRWDLELVGSQGSGGDVIQHLTTQSSLQFYLTVVDLRDGREVQGEDDEEIVMVANCGQCAQRDVRESSLIV